MLVLYLTRPAQAEYQGLDAASAQDYTQVKVAIWGYLDIIEETFQQ